MIRRIFPLLALFLITFSPTLRAAAPKPNIVFILADDLGWADVGCYGADLHETPNLDRLATEGVRFSQAYSMSVCSPTRAAIMTGKHAARLHITIWREGTFDKPDLRRKLIPPQNEHNLPLTDVSLAKALKSAGYLTFHVGKWHLGDPHHYPEAHGFDVNIGGTEWGAPNTYFHPFNGTKTYGDFRYVPGLGIGKPGDYLTDRFTDEAINLIDQAGERPFFLNLCFHAVHTPIEGKPDLVERFRKKITPGMHHQNAGYAAMLLSLDENVGRILRHLQEKHLADNTIVVFTSDNGGYVNKFARETVTNNFPLRSGKGSLYEGGVRVPLIVRWPGVTPAGATCNEPAICMDYFKTLTEAAGVDPSAVGDSGRDGVSLMALLKNPAAKLDRDTLYFHYPHYYATTSPVSAIRQGDWKLLEYFEDHHLELYNLKDDIVESKDLAATMPDRTRELQQRLAAWRTSVGAQLPTVRAQALGPQREGGFELLEEAMRTEGQGWTSD
jgi:arylsulfatase A-like enzyme